MHGIVIRALQQMVEAEHGVQAWERIVERAGVDVEVFLSGQAYPEAMTGDLIAATCAELAVSRDALLESFGIHWVLSDPRRSYGGKISAAGSTLRDLLVNLPVIYARMNISFPQMQPPEFTCSDTRERSMRIHYRSARSGFAPFVKGLFLGLGRRYDTPVTVKQVADRSAGADHDEFDVSW